MDEEDSISRNAREQIRDRRMLDDIFVRGCLFTFLAVVLLMMVCTICVVATG